MLKKGIRVLLDATGLDEAFGGYKIHHFLYLNEVFKKNENKFFLKQLKYFAKKWMMTEESVFKTLKELHINKNRVQDNSSFSQEKYISNYMKSFHKELSSDDDFSKEDFQSYLKEYIVF